MATELFLRWSPDELPAVTATVIEVLVRRGLLLRNASGRLLAPETSSQEFAELRLLGETLRPILERRFLTLSLAAALWDGSPRARDLENDCHLLAGRLALLYDFNTPEFAGKATFSALIGNLIEAQVMHARGRNRAPALRRANQDAAGAGRTRAAGRGATNHPAHGKRRTGDAGLKVGGREPDGG